MRYLAIFNLCLLLFSSCIKKEEEPSPFGCIGQNFFFVKPLSVSSPVMDYNTMLADTIKAEFSVPVNWKIVTEGTTSHAKTEYSGHSNVISILWDGKSDNSIIYSNQENVSVTLIIPCKTSTVTMFSIDNNRDYSSLGTLLSDFEGNGIIQDQVRLNGYCSNCWSSYFSTPVSEISRFEIVSEDSGPVNAMQGDHYLTIKAKAGESSWFAGGFYLSDLPAVDYSVSNTYLNLMLNSTQISNTKLGITVRINDATKYNYLLPLDWTGWKMVSIKLSDFKDLLGNPMPSLTSNYSLDFGLNCLQTQGQSHEVNMDLVIITRDNPLNHLFYTIN